MSDDPKLLTTVRPWEVPPTEFIRTFPLTVCIYSGSGSLLHQEELDYGKPEDRKLLGKMTYWAVSNDLTVETSKSKKG